MFLVRDVLDKQIIDTDGVRVVRVNDLELARVDGHVYVANVDIGGLGCYAAWDGPRPPREWQGAWDVLCRPASSPGMTSNCCPAASRCA